MAAFVAAVGASTAVASSGALTVGPQAMEGNLVVLPGTMLSAGYDFTIPGSHPATDVTFAAPEVVFDGRCVSDGSEVPITISMPTATYAVPVNGGAWFPSGDQHSLTVYEGSTAVPDACGGGEISLAQGGTFSTVVEADAPVPGDGVHVRWHYSANGSSGSWSGTAHVEPGPTGGGQ